MFFFFFTHTPYIYFHYIKLQKFQQICCAIRKYLIKMKRITPFKYTQVLSAVQDCIFYLCSLKEDRITDVSHSTEYNSQSYTWNHKLWVNTW